MTDVRIHLFGGLRVTGDGAPPPVRGAIPEAILCRLALDPERSFTTGELVEALWPAASDSVVSSLRAHLSRLRTRGWDDLLPGGRGGYRLAVDPAAVDVIRFRRLLETTGDDRAAALAEAEALWTGAPLARVSEFPFAAPVITELGMLRRAAAAERADRELAAARPANALAALAPWADDLDDDEMGRRLAQALAEGGRTADALGEIDRRVAHRREVGGAVPETWSRLRDGILRGESHGGAGGAPGPAADAGAVRGGDASGAVGAARGVRVGEHGGPVDPAAGVQSRRSALIGRAAELDRIADARAQSRLVTLTGPAGVGKTRLAAEVARRGAGSDDDAQWFVDLTVIRSPDRLIGAVAETLGCASEIDAIAAALGGRRTLVVFDNVEHVLGATAALASALLERCAGLSVLVTSREAMRMAGERVVAVEPLLGGALDDAVDLFLQRASESSGTTAWNDDDRTAVRRLCVALDGLPLAIELAAARLDVLSLGEVAGSLEALAPGRGTGRHDSLDAAIDWSVGMISDDERRTLGQLARFSGPFGLDAVAGICRIEGADAREMTIALVRRSLVVPAGAGGGERRFRLLDTVRRYARAHLQADDGGDWEGRHGRWMAAYAERTAPLLRSTAAPKARASLRGYAADLQDATARAIRSGDRSLAVELVGSLAWFWYERGQADEALNLIDQALAVPGPRLSGPEARALYAATFMQAVGGDPLGTVHALRRFAEAADAAADPAHAMIAHTLLGSLAAVEGNIDTRQAELAIAERWRAEVGEGDRWAIADHLYIRGDALRIAGHPAQALDSLEEGYRLAAEIGHTWTLAASCYITGKVLTEVGRPRDAVGILRTGAGHSLAREDRISALAAVNAIAVALGELGAFEDAGELFGLVDALGPRFGFHPVASDGSYAEPFRARAAAALGAAWDAARARGAARDVAWALERAAAVAARV
ncbi:BTAD domain-containing putative transcriptional regulator [Microbacterium sp. CCNWLW134]|uniref:AfsR/SARP family transcriptional regulator n=1 Tax=Microbacterium sp. CCNWLW134 TaxID=3122064 RepID=UPI0030101183